MTIARLSSLLVATLLVSGCSSSGIPGSPGVPEPICVLVHRQMECAYYFE